MSIQMTLVFSTLCVEMAILFVLVCPLPQVVRRKTVKLADVFKASSNFKVGLVFFSLILGMQFVDCLNKLQRFDYLKNPYFTSNNTGGAMLSYEQLASKFYAQRNLYLSGAVLYLELAIFTVMTILKKLVSKEEDFRKLNVKQDFSSEDEEIEKYKELIRVRTTDIEALKKQITGLQKSYDGLNPDSAVSKDD